MNKKLLSMFLVFALLVASFSMNAVAIYEDEPVEGPIPGEIIVDFNVMPEIIEDGENFIVAGITCSNVRISNHTNTFPVMVLLVLPEGANSQEETEAAIAILKEHPDVAYVEQNVGGFVVGDPVYANGDVNKDGEINLTDYTMAKRIVMETYVVAYINSNPADVNGDNVVTANDYILIKRHVMQTYTLI